MNGARSAPHDEFYTLYPTIEEELAHYDFKGLTVYCNTDEPIQSEFINYFRMNFCKLGLKRLISTCWRASGTGFVYDSNVGIIEPLDEDGDFRKAECLEYLRQCDVVVTNPPFSLLTEFIQTMFRFNKKFIIIGNPNVLTCKGVFPYVRDNMMWTGMTRFNTGMMFVLPDSYEKYKYIDEMGRKIGRVATSCWWTNMENERHLKGMAPTGIKFDPAVYKIYDDINATEIPQYSLIPDDYKGPMGVPITFINKHSPSQFRILDVVSPVLEGKKLYKRLIIERV